MISRIRHFLIYFFIACHTTLLLPGCGAQAEPQAISGAPMALGNQLYEAERYAEAIAQYEELVDGGVDNAQLYYNLGNAYFRTDDYGRAVLNFRRAQRLLPRDGDIAANLRLARSLTGDSINTLQENSVTSLVQRTSDWATRDELAILALVFWFLLCGLLVAAILWRQKRRILLYTSLAVAILFTFGILFLGFRLLDERSSMAVVIVPETAVRSGPGDDYLAEFTLHSGTEVRILEQRVDWSRISLPGDLQGWVLRDSLAELFPRDWE